MIWNKVPLKSIASIELGKMLDDEKNQGEEHEYLANINVRWGEFDLSELRRMRFTSNELERFSITKGDIVLCEGGEPGRCAIWKETDRTILYQKALHRIRCFTNTNSRFLYYQLSRMGKAGELDAFFTGSTIKHLPKQNLEQIEINLPIPSIQERLAEILSAYDDLIENNRRQIKLLEESARLLYREWFVRLRFPGHEQLKIIDGVPEGWKNVKYSNICKFQNGYAFKSGSYQSQGKYGIVTISNVKEAMFLPPDKVFIDSIPDNMAPECHIVQGDILLSLTGNVGRCCIAYGANYLLNQRVAKIIPQDGFVNSSFLYYHFNEPVVFKKIINIAHGVAQQNLSTIDLGNLSIILPDRKLVQTFHDNCSPILAKIITLSLSSQKLSLARDLLLPRYMSGELEV